MHASKQKSRYLAVAAVVVVGLLATAFTTQALLLAPSTNVGKIAVIGQGSGSKHEVSEAKAAEDERLKAQAECERICAGLGKTLKSCEKGTSPSPPNTQHTHTNIDGVITSFELSIWDYVCE